MYQSLDFTYFLSLCFHLNTEVVIITLLMSSDNSIISAISGFIIIVCFSPYRLHFPAFCYVLNFFF